MNRPVPFVFRAEVDVGQFASFTLAEGGEVTIWNETEYPAFGEFSGLWWYRLAPGLSGDNSPGVSIAIADTGVPPGHRYGETLGIDSKSQQLTAFMTLKNNGKGTAVGYILWLLAPSGFTGTSP